MTLSSVRASERAAGDASDRLVALGPGEFESWYGDSYTRLLASMIVATGNPSVAREVTDEAFTRAFAHWSRVRQMRSPLGWTYRVATNLNHRRFHRLTLERRALARNRSSSSVVAAAPDFSVEVWAAIEELPRRTRTAIALRYVGGLSDAEIAEAMHVASGTVARLLHEGRGRLAHLLRDESGETDD